MPWMPRGVIDRRLPRAGDRAGLPALAPAVEVVVAVAGAGELRLTAALVLPPPAPPAPGCQDGTLVRDTVFALNREATTADRAALPKRFAAGDLPGLVPLSAASSLAPTFTGVSFTAVGLLASAVFDVLDAFDGGGVLDLIDSMLCTMSDTDDFR